MNQDNKFLIFAGASTLFGLGLGSFLYFNNNSQKKMNKDIVQLPRDLVLQILKHLRNEFFSTFTSIASFGIQIKEQLRGQNIDVKEYLQNQEQFMNEIKHVEQQAYQKFNVTKKQFKYACQNIYHNDDEITGFQDEMKEQFDKACEGVLPDSKSQIPEFLTPDKVIEIYQEIYINCNISVMKSFLELKNQGEAINYNNPKVLQALNTFKQDLIKKEILTKNNLDNLSDPAAKIFQHATQEYAKSNKDQFQEKIARLDQKHQKTLQMIIANPMLGEDFIRKSLADEAALAFSQFANNPYFQIQGQEEKKQ